MAPRGSQSGALVIGPIGAGRGAGGEEGGANEALAGFSLAAGASDAALTGDDVVLAAIAADAGVTTNHAATKAAKVTSARRRRTDISGA